MRGDTEWRAEWLRRLLLTIGGSDCKLGCFTRQVMVSGSSCSADYLQYGLPCGGAFGLRCLTGLHVDHAPIL
ncbi:hypothetical protein XELAEV_18017016mg [Xenopus laevis]|uniref:Uncharacterized protein n=1 Tax=Xenopus laevis TaxID=8355 RepID=A0A974HS87_XENLA|nr:hypothetical protein XELAEV_18017016mg [Xenopus laevis]